ncbi:CLUMA_CG016107, isoform A [Clunio marinus]|uniref:CLUMA_CG016107, isoform A n=1 Tax=Clunio marinus TaxID=568069 RepID=A0A1J1ISU4_9DIPT|nr:CLUMA_CG016107, isoform A [Clunio marinus]
MITIHNAQTQLVDTEQLYNSFNKKLMFRLGIICVLKIIRTPNGTSETISEKTITNLKFQFSEDL